MKAGSLQYMMLCSIYLVLDTCKSPGARALSAKKYHTFLQNLAVFNEAVKNRRQSELPRDEIAEAFNLQTASARFYGAIDLKVHGNSKCPSKEEIMAKQSFKVCPAYYVTEYDANRIPAIIFQVRCRCLSCQGPHHGNRHKCSPLFKFINAFRVIDKTQSGTNIFGKVREPVSYGCQCKDDAFGLRRTYIPP